MPILDEAQNLTKKKQIEEQYFLTYISMTWFDHRRAIPDLEVYKYIYIG